jgi:hypothetical protein
MTSWFGFSGSPIFANSGRVMAINNSGRALQRHGLNLTLAYGVRIDCLWELLEWHGLTDKVASPLPRSELRLSRFEEEDPSLARIRQAADLTARGRVLSLQHRYARRSATHFGKMLMAS